MDVKRWALVVVLSAPGGFIWACAFADLEPNWMCQINGVLAWLLMLLPLVVMLTCAAAFAW